jgi:hypothetical protein
VNIKWLSIRLWVLGKVGVSWHAGCIEVTLEVARSTCGVLGIDGGSHCQHCKEHCSENKAVEFHPGKNHTIIGLSFLRCFDESVH